MCEYEKKYGSGIIHTQQSTNVVLATQEYLTLMQHYLNGDFSGKEFVHKYIRKKQGDSRGLNDEVWTTLCALFISCDQYTEDPWLLAKEPYYIREPEFQRGVQAAVAELTELQKKPRRFTKVHRLKRHRFCTIKKSLSATSLRLKIF
jgi:hypothetical protein